MLWLTCVGSGKAPLIEIVEAAGNVVTHTCLRLYHKGCFTQDTISSKTGKAG